MHNNIFSLYFFAGKIHCAACSKSCKGQAVRLQELYFHVKCFKCAGMYYITKSQGLVTHLRYLRFAKTVMSASSSASSREEAQMRQKWLSSVPSASTLPHPWPYLKKRPRWLSCQYPSALFQPHPWPHLSLFFYASSFDCFCASDWLRVYVRESGQWRGWDEAEISDKFCHFWQQWHIWEKIPDNIGRDNEAMDPKFIYLKTSY